QLKKLDDICSTRNRHGDRITEGIKDVEGIYPHQITKGGKSSYWFYMFRINEDALTCTRDEFSKALQAEGIPGSAGYIPNTVYEYGMMKNREAYLGSEFPFDINNTHYEKGLCPTAEKILETAIRLPVNEFFSEQDIEETLNGIRKVAKHFAKN